MRMRESSLVFPVRFAYYFLVEFSMTLSCPSSWTAYAACAAPALIKLRACAACAAPALGFPSGLVPPGRNLPSFVGNEQIGFVHFLLTSGL